MTARRLLGLCLTALLATAARAEAPATPEREIEAFVRARLAAQQTRDLESVMATMPRDARVTAISEGRILRGWEAIRSRTELAYQSQKVPELSLDSLDVTALDPRHALVIASYSIRVQLTSGPMQLVAAETLLL